MNELVIKASHGTVETISITGHSFKNQLLVSKSDTKAVRILCIHHKDSACLQLSSILNKKDFATGKRGSDTNFGVYVLCPATGAERQKIQLQKNKAI